MTVVTRFAPSPTGRLHVGNLRVALLNWLLARKAGGQFMLRLDDTDAARSTAGFAQTIRDDLDWTGLKPDGEVAQSERSALYEARFAQLHEAGRVYPAWETPAELELKRKVALGRSLPPVYDRAALALSAGQRDALIAGGSAPHWRFRLDEATEIAWHDAVRGRQRFDPALLGDPVVRRADGSWLYLLPSVIDDIDMGVTDVVRGEDHVTNTALQIQMFAALGAPLPRFGHVALLAGADGKLSKRAGDAGLSELRDAGIEPIALLALLARIGTSDPVEPVADIAPLIAGFDLARFGRAPARFDPGELTAVSAKTVHRLPFAAVAEQLPEGMTPAVWDVLRGNLSQVSEAAEWWPVVAGDIAAPPTAEEDRTMLATAAETADSLSWEGDPWHALTAAAGAASGRRGRALFLPLRRALTGRDHGPDMAALLPLIGRERAILRLCAAAAG